jgi:hypothetical protein
MKYGSFIYWGWNLLLKVQYPLGVLLPCPGAPPGAPPGCSLSETRLFELAETALPVTRDILVLVGMLLALRAATYVALAAKTRFVQAKASPDGGKGGGKGGDE